MKVYISGPITSVSDNNVHEFSKAEHILFEYGHQPINPHNLPGKENCKEWVDYLKLDIKALVDCDAIYMLKGWEDSKGARLEHRTAKDLGLPIRYSVEAFKR